VSLPRDIEDAIVEILARALLNDLRASSNATNSQGEAKATDGSPSGSDRKRAGVRAKEAPP
jgi:hypothetical protein